MSTSVLSPTVAESGRVTPLSVAAVSVATPSIVTSTSDRDLRIDFLLAEAGDVEAGVLCINVTSPRRRSPSGADLSR